MATAAAGGPESSNFVGGVHPLQSQKDPAGLSDIKSSNVPFRVRPTTDRYNAAYYGIIHAC